ncbi:MAG: hypothetical protein GC137_06820 [Alphaproteobacteria bacterium]|nr:hypothetical protein [Alphaproteobacteria bacterium]
MNVKFKLIILAILLFVPAPVNAQAQIVMDTGPEAVIMPVLGNNYVAVDNNDQFPLEPNIGQIDFRKIPEVSETSERIAALIQGITIDIPPEYDHYGYEIRRYMSRIGNIKIYEDPEYLVEQIKNVRKSKVIAKFWADLLKKEITDIQALIDQDTDRRISLASKTAFRQNQRIAETFLISLDNWLVTNEEYLLHILDNQGKFVVSYPNIMIDEESMRVQFYNKALLRQTRLKEIKEYLPFSIMAY